MFVSFHSNTTVVTSGTGTASPSEVPALTPVFSKVHVTRSLALWVVFCRSLFVPFLIAIGWYVLLQLRLLISPWYLQTFLSLDISNSRLIERWMHEVLYLYVCVNITTHQGCHKLFCFVAFWHCWINTIYIYCRKNVIFVCTHSETGQKCSQKNSFLPVLKLVQINIYFLTMYIVYINKWKTLSWHGIEEVV